MPRNSIHKQLKLQGTYRVNLSISGYDIRQGYEGASWTELRRMVSPTAGTTVVHAMAVGHQPWMEVSESTFMSVVKYLTGIT